MQKTTSSSIHAIALTLLITFLLCMPGSEFPKITWLSKIWFDKWVHILFFLILVTAWCRAFSERKDWNKLNQKFLQITIYCLLYGIAMELVQNYFIPFRSFEWGDIIADGTGCITGLIYSSKKYGKK